MLKNITWTEYCSAVLLLSAAYYLLIGLRYYGADLQTWFSNRQRPANPIDDEPVETGIAKPANLTQIDDEQPFAATSEETFDEVEELISRLKTKLAEPGTGQQSRDDLKRSVKGILLDYPQLSNSQFAPAIKELIATECAKNSSLLLEEDEIADLWQKAD